MNFKKSIYHKYLSLSLADGAETYIRHSPALTVNHTPLISSHKVRKKYSYKVIAWTYSCIFCSHSCHHHLLTSPSFTSSSPLLSCLDNITAYYFSYFHPSLCPYRPVSQAVMCDLELSLQLWVLSVEVQWLVYWNLTGGVTLNKPTSPSSPVSSSSSDFCCVLLEDPLWVRGFGGRVLVPGGMWLMTISQCHHRFLGGVFEPMFSLRCMQECVC